MKTSQDPSSPMTAGPMAMVPINANLKMNTTTMITTTAAAPIENRDGWDNEDWGSLEEEPVNEELEEKASNEMNHISASRSNSNSQSHSSSMGVVYNNNISNNVSPSKNGDDTTTTTTTQHNSSANNSNWDNYGPSWNDDDFEPLEETGNIYKDSRMTLIKFEFDLIRNYKV